VPSIADALVRGARGVCPACGRGHLFTRFLKVAPACSSCSAPLGQARADDAPPYFTIVLVGHIVLPLMVVVERTFSPPLWVHAAVWVPATLGLCLGLLQPIKGMTVGVMTAMKMLTPNCPG
jgi:uncharacterized protein (DUF983 family)